MEFDSIYSKYFLDYNIRMDISMYHSKCKIEIAKASSAACRLL
jgi:hypothetical protein